MSSFKVTINLPHRWSCVTRAQWVEEWSARLLSESHHFLGAIEGSALTERRILDEGISPRDRDLVRDLDWSEVAFYFSDRFIAEAMVPRLLKEIPFATTPKLEIEIDKDWNQNWREQFQGVELSPDWHILPEWRRSMPRVKSSLRPLYINPGMGFGSGEHATTALCLKSIGRLGDLSNARVLDFGAGSGILSIAAALKGAEVDAVEIDDEALKNAADCIQLNSIQDRVTLLNDLRECPGDRRYDLILANILSPVLIEFASKLVDRMKSRSTLVLSGLLREQVDEVLDIYRPLLNRPSVSIEYDGEWAAITFQIWNPPSIQIQKRSGLRGYLERLIESR